jgi:glutamate-1-semialdehyde 2,1-aminomutase
MVGGTPLFIESANAARLTSADGREYLDFCMAFGPLILGHADPDVTEAVTAALNKGWSYGAADAVSLELAELITGHIDWIDRVRFVNSGTEAVMTALRLARAVTGRDKVLKFDGCYHGHTDAMLIRAGSGLAGATSPDSAGVTTGISRDTLIAPLDDEMQLAQILEQHHGDVAAVIIEPLPANHGLLPQRAAFLQSVDELCRAHGALLIFDEIITGFRLGFGGYAQQSGITPDIVTWGKIIGGGFPVGAIAARADIMDHLAPVGPVYQAGTLSANPVAMTAGLTTLQKLLAGDIYAELESLGRQLEDQFGNDRVVQVDGARMQRAGSLFWFVPDGGDAVIRSNRQIPESMGRLYPDIFHALLERGIYLPPSPYEVGFLSTAHTAKDIEQLAVAMSAVMHR